MNSNDSVVIFWLIVVFGLSSWWTVRDSNWFATLYAKSKYNVASEKIEISGKKPHDCDFMTAPIGSKHCSYKREYLVEWLTLSTDNPRRPITYGTLQEMPPTNCSSNYDDSMRKCYYTEISTGERATSAWTARRVEVRWKKIEE
jgi:hypothetical protein